MIALQVAFWLAAALIVYTYAGYPLCVYLASRQTPRPTDRSSACPSATLLIPAYDEEDVIRAKLDNSLALHYPTDRLRILVVTDGSDDATPEIVAQYATKGVLLAHQPQREGKSAAINRAMPLVTTDITVLSDANAMLNRDSLLHLTKHFGNPLVAGVAGEKQVLGAGEGWYWRYESFLKRCESRIHSVMGAVGELFAFRSKLFSPLPPEALTDDFVLSLRLVLAGWRVVYEPRAIATEEDAPSMADQWERRARNTAGGLQALRYIGGMLSPARLILAWQFFSHKVLRFAITPILLPLAYLVNLALVGIPLYRGMFVAQSAFYLAALAGYLLARRGVKISPFHAIFYFCLANAAALAGVWRHLRGTQPIAWAKAR